MLVSLLSRKNMTIYALSKKSGVAYSTLNYIVNGKTPYEKCSISTFKKIADALEMSMNELYEECNYTIDDFEVFKSNVGHRIKEIGQLDFIEEILLSDILEKYWKEGKQIQVFYLVAMVDYLSRINEVPLCDKFNVYRNYRMKTKVFPASYYAHKKFNPAYELRNVIPEFEKYGIMEGEIFNVV